MVSAMIDVKNGRFSLHMGEEKLEFNLSKVTASPSLEDACYQVDVTNKVVFEEMGPLNSLADPLAYLLGTFDKSVEAQLGDERAVYAHILNMAPLFHPQHLLRGIPNLELRLSKEDKKCTPEAKIKAISLPLEV